VDKLGPHLESVSRCRATQLGIRNTGPSARHSREDGNPDLVGKPLDPAAAGWRHNQLGALSSGTVPRV